MEKKHIIAAILIGIFFLSCFGYLFIYITNYKKEMDQINVEQILDDLETQKFEANKVEYITQEFNVGMDQINISGMNPADAEYIASGGELPPADNAVVNVYKTTIEQYLSNKRFAEATKKLMKLCRNMIFLNSKTFYPFFLMLHKHLYLVILKMLMKNEYYFIYEKP